MPVKSSREGASGPQSNTSSIQVFPLTAHNLKENHKRTTAVVEEIMAGGRPQVQEDLEKHIGAHIKMLIERIMPKEVGPVAVQLEAQVEIDFERDYYNDLGVKANVNHHSIQAAYDAGYKLWSPISPGGKKRWRGEMFSRAENYRHCHRGNGRKHHHHRHYHRKMAENYHRKVAKNWKIIENARKVLLIPENRATYDAVRAEGGYDLEIALEWDIAGQLKHRNEDLGSYLEGGGEDANDGDSMVVRWCGRTGI